MSTRTSKNWPCSPKTQSPYKQLGLQPRAAGRFIQWHFHARQAEPRVGVAYNVKKTNTVIRASYARTMETPFNENLILASNGCTDPVINALMSSTISPCVSNVPLSPGTRNEFHAGLQQVFSKYLVVDGEYIWKYTQRGFDFSVLGDSPITFPVEWAKSKIPGFALRVSVHPSAASGCASYSMRATLQLRTESPRNSSRSLCSPPALRCVSAWRHKLKSAKVWPKQRCAQAERAATPGVTPPGVARPSAPGACTPRFSLTAPSRSCRSAPRATRWRRREPSGRSSRASGCRPSPW